MMAAAHAATMASCIDPTVVTNPPPPPPDASATTSSATANSSTATSDDSTANGVAESADNKSPTMVTAARNEPAVNTISPTNSNTTPSRKANQFKSRFSNSPLMNSNNYSNNNANNTNSINSAANVIANNNGHASSALSLPPAKTGGSLFAAYDSTSQQTSKVSILFNWKFY